MIVRRTLVLAALALLVAASGCSGKRERAEVSRQVDTGEAPRSKSPALSEPGRGGAATDSTESVSDSTEAAAELFSRIHDHESKLSQTIIANRLDEVGPEAFLIRDLIVTAARQASVPANQKAALDQHVSAVRSMAADLSEAGRAGNLNAVKAGNGGFQRELGMIERLIGQAHGSNPGTE